jgi:hypothetical protein
VVAAHDGKHAPGVGELAFLHLFHPCTENADWHIVLRFAGSGAGVAANALAIVYDKPEFHVFSAWLRLQGNDGVKLVGSGAIYRDFRHFRHFKVLF